MKTLLRVVFALSIFPLTITAQENGDSPVSSPDENEFSTMYIAQNTQDNKKESEKKDQSRSSLPPPPAPRTSITTEKPIQGAPSGIVQQRKAGQTVVPGSTPSTPGVIPTQAGAPVSPGRATTTNTPTQTTARRTRSKKKSDLVKEELSIFNVSTDNLRTMKPLMDDDFNLRGMVYGEERGYIRILDADNDGKFTEVWKSPPMNAPVRELFIDDIDKDGETEIVAYTNDGNIFIYGYKTHSLKYRTPENTYPGISCMVVENIDDDPQLELIFIASQPGTPGNLVQFDTKSQFEEWRSSQEYTATDMIIGNVDTDSEIEIILNTGEILSSKFKNVKWKSDIQFGDRLYLVDVDNDGILELVTEYDQSYIRIIDVDERREKW